MKKWDGGRVGAHGGKESGRVINPSPVFWGPGVSPPGNCFENIGANLCNLVDLGGITSSKVGRKMDVFPSHF